MTMQTNVRDTSLRAYAGDVKPTLGDRQRIVYRALQEQHALGVVSMTNSELAEMLSWPINTITPRIYELRAKGVVVEDCKRACKLTGRMAYAWRVAETQDSLF